jgi:putative transposase
LKSDIFNLENLHRMLLLRDSISSYRTEVLDARIFNNLVEVREITTEWVEHYNNKRPHESLQNLSPMQYLLKKENSSKQNSISEFSPFQQNHSTPTSPQ